MAADSGTYDEGSVNRKRKIAELLLSQGLTEKPIQHWTQGLAQMAKAGVGGYLGYKADQDEKANDQSLVSALLGGSQTSQAPSNSPQNLMPQASNFGDAISGIESGGKYDALGPETKGDRAYGKYQIMGNNIPEWSQAALGKSLTPEQFLADPKAQDAIFNQKFGSYVDKYGPEGASKAWFAGEGGMNNPNAKDVLGTSVAGYGKKFMSNLGGSPTSGVAQALGGQPPVQVADSANSRIAKILTQNPSLARKLAPALLAQQLKGDDPTDDIKEYNFAKTHPDFYDSQIALKRAGATNVNNMLPSGEKAYDAEQGKTYATTFTDMQKAGRDSIGAVSNINKMEELTNDPNFYSGAGGEAVTKAKNLAVSLGITDAGNAAPNELFSKIAKKTVLDSAGGSLGTGFSNADRSFLEATVPALTTTKEGNKQIIQLVRKVQQRNQEVAKLAREYAKNNGGRIDAGFDDTLAQYAEENPLFAGMETPAAPPINAPTQPYKSAIEAEIKRRGLKL